MGTQAENLAADRRPEHLQRLPPLLNHCHLGVLPQRPQESREGRRLLYHVRRGLVLVQHHHVVGGRRHPARKQGQRRRRRHVGLELQGQQTPGLVQGRRPLRTRLPVAGLVAHLLHHRGRGRGHRHRHLRDRVLPLLVQEPAPEVHGRPRPRPHRPVPRPAAHAVGAKHPRLRQRPDPADARLPFTASRSAFAPLSPGRRRRPGGAFAVARPVRQRVAAVEHDDLAVQVAGTADPRARRDAQDAVHRQFPEAGPDVVTAAASSHVSASRGQSARALRRRPGGADVRRRSHPRGLRPAVPATATARGTDSARSGLLILDLFLETPFVRGRGA